MDGKVFSILLDEAKRAGLGVAPSFEQWVDQYIHRLPFAISVDQQTVIETYLSNAAIRIARADRKRLIEGDDAKAAVWLFHQPEDLTDECVEAVEFAFRMEGKRKEPPKDKIVVGGVTHGLLNESFARHLDGRSGRGYRPYLSGEP